SVKRGGDRQQIHEIIRNHSHAAARRVKVEGKENDLIDRLAEDDGIPLNKDEILATLRPECYIGRCVGQVEEFLAEYVKPTLERLYDPDVRSELFV
ncbi:MAG: adenylosuccinate lyase, partial [Clostridia bacterium]|nr:adenylosuccinate lyase [Clostridia bacterium]